MQIINDHKDLNVVNLELYKIGYNMGIRMVDEFFARTNIEQCRDFYDTISVLTKVGFKMFLGIEAEISRASSDNRTFHITFKNNPLLDFVELPQGMEQLNFSNVIPGAITGALRMLSMVVECTYVQDKLKGHPEDEISIKLIQIVNEGYVEAE
jgi:hypothetical protein